MAVGRKTGGRRKGTANKSTRAAKDAIALFIDGNAHKLQGWLDAIEETDGAQAAFQCIVCVLEFHVPKMARVENTGDGGGPIIIQMTPTDAAL